MKLIVGLGNPGEKYKNTRHNVGFMVTDRLKALANGEEWKEEKKFQAVVSKLLTADVLLVKPTTFMNESGNSVSKLANYYKILIPNTWIIHDDLDIKLGQYKIQLGKGPMLHNGVNSIEEKLGSNDFWRVRVGVDNRDSKPSGKISGEEYVLQDFLPDESILLNGVTEKVIQELLDKLRVG